MLTEAGWMSVVDRLRVNMDQLRAELATVTAERDAWRTAHGPFGPRTPAEVAVFEEEGSRVSREVGEHEASLRAALERELAETKAALELCGHVQNSRDLANALEASRAETDVLQLAVDAARGLLAERRAETAAATARIAELEALLAQATIWRLWGEERITGLEAEIAANTREFGRLYGEQDKSRAEAYQRLETIREAIAAYLEHAASVEVGSVLSEQQRETVGMCASWVRNQLDEKWAKEREALRDQ